MSDQKLKERLRKLLALSRSSNPAEAVRGKDDAWSHGWRDGKNARLDHGVNGDTPSHVLGNIRQIGAA